METCVAAHRECLNGPTPSRRTDIEASTSDSVTESDKARLLDQMEREGLIGKADGARPRPVLAKSFELVQEWDEQEASQ